MIVIGEKINSSIKSIETAVQNQDEAAIQEIASKQVENGADYLDVNCGTFINDEEENIKWLINVVQSVENISVCIDSPNAKAIEAGLKAVKTGNPIINSITAEKVRWESILPLAVEHKASVVALCMDDNGMPEEPEARLRVALKMAEEMAKKGVTPEKIFFDPMVKPISTDSRNGLLTLEAMRLIRKEVSDAHITCGLSNISFGLPLRKLINQSFLVASIFAGLDTAIVDPLDKKLMSLMHAAEALAGKDEYCMEYITRYRSGQIEV